MKLRSLDRHRTNPSPRLVHDERHGVTHRGLPVDDVAAFWLARLFTDLVADHATHDCAADCAYRATACEHSSPDGAYPCTSGCVDASLRHARATHSSHCDKER